MLMVENDKQKRALDSLRESLKDLDHPQHEFDHYLLRWLKARNFNVAKAESMIRAHYQWRKDYKVDQILEEYKEPEVLRLYEPGGYCGKDREGHPLWIYPMGTVDICGIMRSCTKKEIVRHRVWQAEHLLNVILPRHREQTGYHVYHSTVILDMEHASFIKMMSRPALELQKEISRLSEQNYPETLKKLFIINAPSFFHILFKIFKPLMNEETIKKIHIYGSNFEDILRFIDPKELPIKYGGSMVDSYGDPACSEYIKYGRQIPDYFYLNIGNDYQLNEVGRGDKFTIDFIVTLEKIPCRLQWKFESIDHEISYGVFKQEYHDHKNIKEMKIIVPIERCFSHLTLEHGFCPLESSGTYIFVFDNTMSWTKTKIRHRIEIIKFDNESSLRYCEISSNQSDNICDSDYHSEKSSLQTKESEEGSKSTSLLEDDIDNFFRQADVEKEDLWFCPRLCSTIERGLGTFRRSFHTPKPYRKFNSTFVYNYITQHSTEDDDLSVDSYYSAMSNLCD